jgi:hypothetical protein
MCRNSPICGTRLTLHQIPVAKIEAQKFYLNHTRSTRTSPRVCFRGSDTSNMMISLARRSLSFRVSEKLIIGHRVPSFAKCLSTKAKYDDLERLQAKENILPVRVSPTPSMVKPYLTCLLHFCSIFI